MKKSIRNSQGSLCLLVIIFLGFDQSFAQENTIGPTGKVGIGTNSIIPRSRLDVQSLTNSSGDNTAIFSAPNLGPNASHIHHGLNGTWYIRSANSNGKVILQDLGGNVGVGTSNPQYKLDVNTTFSGEQSSVAIQQVNTATSNPVLMPTSKIIYSWYNTPKASINFHRGRADHDGFISFSTSDANVITERMRIFLNGNIGIGTTNVDDNNFKLFVETGIRTRKVKVDINNWPDYVFDKQYPLMSLSSLKFYVAEHSHLPDVPSASEVISQGIDLGATQSILLKKIEELTLYIIQLDEKVTRQNADLKKLKGR